MSKFLYKALFLTSVTFSVSAETLPAGFIYLHKLDSSIEQQLEFSTANNFLGTAADGYEGNQVICTKEAAMALSNVQKMLKAKGFSLLILDGYRPTRAVEHIQRWAQDLADQKTKIEFYPDIEKKELLGTFLAAKRSSHSRGSTFDVVIIDGITKKPMDFGPNVFGEKSNTFSKSITKQQKENRLFLRKVMLVHGFKPYDAEFWHFTYKNEPFPETYFNFVIQNAEK